ncbi:hypothetical protein [Thermonema rossianum]|uniref:hypothetical protein n=1 Tax=Thermonema rossianum TaxID=55505 RepID=UPI000570683A|nr:hypothetical protein [Thermonema rossianum]
MKKLLLLFLLSFLAAVPAAWANEAASQLPTVPAFEATLAKSSNEEATVAKPNDCVTFGATLSCGVAVTVTACNVTTSQIVTAILSADVAICGGADKVVIMF